MSYYDIALRVSFVFLGDEQLSLHVMYIHSYIDKSRALNIIDNFSKRLV